MKRCFLALLLVCTLICSMICVPVFANEGTVTKVYGQNFDDLADGKNSNAHADATYSGSEVFGSNADTSRSKITTGYTAEHVSGKLQRHYVQKTTGAVYFPMSTPTYVEGDNAFATEGANADLYVDFDFNMSASVPANKESIILADTDGMGSSTPQVLGAHTYVNVAAVPTDAAAGALQIATGFADNTYTYAEVADSSFTMKEWNHMTIVVHATDSSALKGTYDVYLNGAQVVTGAALMQNGAPAETRDSIRMLALAAKGANGSTSEMFDIENLYIYKTQNAVLANHGAILKRISSLRTELTLALNTGAIDQTAYDEHTTLLDGCMTVYKTAQGQGYTEAQLGSVTATLTSIEEALSNVGVVVKPGGLKYQNDYAQNNAGFYDDTYGIGTHFINGYSTVAETKWDLITNENITAGNGLEIPREATELNGVTYHALNEGAGATMVFEFDLYTHELRATQSDLVIRVVASDRTSDASNGLFNVKIKGADGLIYRMYNNDTYTYDDASTTYTTPMEDNQWYRIRIEVRATSDEGEVSGAQTMYVDGKLVFNSIYTATKSLNKHGELNTLSLIKVANAESAVNYGPRIYVDNVSAYKANSENAITVNKGALIAAIREAELFAKTTKQYTETTLAGLNTAISTAKAAAENADASGATVAAATQALESYIAAMTADNTEYFTLKGFAFADAQNARTYEAVSGGSLTGVYLTKNAPSQADKVFVAAYRNGVLENIEMVTIPSEMAVGATQCVNLAAPIAVSDIDGCSLKAFVWENTTLEPITGSTQNLVKTDKTGTTIFLIGDSTVCNYADNQYPRKGWGQMLSNYFEDGITIDNRAVSGESSKSFMNKYWADVIDDVKAGDYVFIQFGHNDEKQSASLYTNSKTDYKANLTQYITEIRAKGAVPVLFTPVARALSTGGVFVGAVCHRDYPQAVLEAAEENNVLAIDLLDLHCAWVEAEGFSNIKKDMWLFVDVDDPRYTGVPAFANSEYRTSGASDTTHFAVYGADILAKLVTDALESAGHPLANYMKEYTPVKNS